MLRLSTLLFALCLTAPARAQKPVYADAGHRCIYHGGVLNPELFSFSPGERTPNRVDRILQAGNAERQFQLLHANVDNVAAVADSGRYYLLYNEDFLSALADEPLALAVLAHAVGHLVNRHTLDDTHRIWEELEADAFAGYVLFVLGAAGEADLAAIPEKLRLSYPVTPDQRRTALQNGWQRGEASFKARTDNKYLDNSSSNSNQWRMPDLPWPPPCCPNTYPLGEQLQRDFRTLGELDARLSAALQSRGYTERRYLSLPNGFALVTKMEQFDGATGVPKSAGRWLDYPVKERFDGLLDYLRSLIVPNHGYFRVFVFAVTDRPANSPGAALTKAEAAAWLRNGFNRLPPELAGQRLGSRHFADAYVYLFEATDADYRARPCLVNCLNDCRLHLERSGILGAWERK